MDDENLMANKHNDVCPIIISKLDDIHNDIRLISQSRLISMGFKEILDISEMWTWQTDQDDRFIYLSEHVSTFSGASAQEYVGKKRVQVADTGISQPVLSKLGQTIEQRAAFSRVTYRQRTIDGGSRWIEISGVPVYDEKQTFLGYYGVGRDVTKQRNSEIDQMKHLNQLVRAITNVDAAIMSTDHYGNIWYVNQSWKDYHRKIANFPDANNLNELRFDEYLRILASENFIIYGDITESQWLSWRISKHEKPDKRPITIQLKDGTNWVVQDTKNSIGTTTISIRK